MWHSEPEIQSWLNLIADRLYLDRFVSSTCYGVGARLLHEENEEDESDEHAAEDEGNEEDEEDEEDK